MVSACTLPPDGWRCAREGGHDGPCAAVPEITGPERSLISLLAHSKAMRGELEMTLSPLVVVAIAEHAASLQVEVERLRAALGEQRHIADIRDQGFGLQHPVECRPNLIDCPVNVALESLHIDEVPVPGRYIVTLDGDGLSFEALDS